MLGGGSLLLTFEGLAFAEANRTELNTSSLRRTAFELFFYFCVFFFKSSVRSKRTSKLTEYDAIFRFGSIEPNRTFYKKNTKIIKKFECGSS